MTNNSGNDVQIGSSPRWYGRLVFIVTILGVVALGLTNLQSIVNKVGSLWDTLGRDEASVASAGECWDISVKHAETFPYSL